jgi:hypothetical protein
MGIGLLLDWHVKIVSPPLTMLLLAQDGCRAIAEAARKVVLESASHSVAVEYMYLMLKYIHDLK